MRCTYFCGMQTVHELQKMSAYDVNIKQRRYNRLTVTTSTMRSTAAELGIPVLSSEITQECSPAIS